MNLEINSFSCSQKMKGETKILKELESIKTSWID